MKLAVANNVGQQFSTEGKAIYYEVVADGYNFSGNAKLDVTNYDDLRLFWSLGQMTLSGFQSSIQSYWTVVNSGQFGPISQQELSALYSVQDRLPSGLNIPSFPIPASPSPDFGNHEIQEQFIVINTILSGVPFACCCLTFSFHRS